MRHDSLLLHCLLVFLGLALSCAALPSRQFVVSGQDGPGKKGAVDQDGPGKKGAVATESTVCSQIGADLLRLGGNAADAMVGAQLCVGVVGMYHSGIGGGGWMLIRAPDGTYESVDYREVAPAAATKDMFASDMNATERASERGPLSVAVPGELKGLEYVHDKYGVLDWSAVVKPSIDLARNGFEVTADLVRYMNNKWKSNAFLTEDPIWAREFAPTGKFREIGERMTRPNLADTLEEIAERGANAFYEGRIAESMVNYIQSLGGILTLDDLRNYEISTKPAQTARYRGGYRLFATEAPTSGAVLLSILKTMEQYPHGDLERDPDTALHRLVEAMKFGFGARSEIGDPDFVPRMASFQAQIHSERKARQIRSRIDDFETHPVHYYHPNGTYAPDSHGTAHLAAADASGMTIASTTTINLLFGSALMTPDTGIILNDEMDDFSQPGRRNAFDYEPSPNNWIVPGKRPLSSAAPLIVEHPNGTLYFTIGAAGGSRIISTVAQTAWNVLEKGMDMRDALDEPRLHHQLMPATLSLEGPGAGLGFDEAFGRRMEARGHKVVWIDRTKTAAQAVVRQWDGSFVAAAEPRQAGAGGATA